MNLLTAITRAHSSTLGTVASVAQACAHRLAAGARLSSSRLSQLMTEAHGVIGRGWCLVLAYDAVEAAQEIAFRCASAGAQRGDPAALLGLAREIAARCPTQSRWFEAQMRLQQFSTPLPVAVVADAAHVRKGGLALEPACGTWLIG